MNSRAYVNDTISATVDSDDPQGGCVIDFDFHVEIDSGDTDFPATAAMSYQAYDSSMNLLDVYGGPDTVDVDNEINSKRWESDEQTVTVDCTLAQTNPCYVAISAADIHDTTKVKLYQFNCPCLDSGTHYEAAASSPQAPASSLPEVEIIIRIKGGSPKITTGRPCGGRSHVRPRQIEAKPTPKTRPRMNQKDSEKKEPSKEKPSEPGRPE